MEQRRILYGSFVLYTPATHSSGKYFHLASYRVKEDSLWWSFMLLLPPIFPVNIFILCGHGAKEDSLWQSFVLYTLATHSSAKYFHLVATEQCRIHYVRWTFSPCEAWSKEGFSMAEFCAIYSSHAFFPYTFSSCGAWSNGEFTVAEFRGTLATPFPGMLFHLVGHGATED